MKQKLEEKTKKLRQLINTITNGRQQLAQLEQEALMLQGEIRLLKEMELEKAEESKVVEEIKKE